MTLAKEKLNTSKAASSAGVLFTSLTRVRHPDTLLLHDNFPSYAQIMRGRVNKSFKMRQDWERKARAKFSRTIRRHMRDEQTYSPDKVWTEAQSDLADLLLRDYATHVQTTVEDHPANFAERHPTFDLAMITSVWKKLQLFPHCFEVAERRNALNTLNLDGTPSDSFRVPDVITDLHYEAWTVHVDSLQNFAELAILVPGVLEFLAHSLRMRLEPESDCFLRHDVLRNRKMSHTMKLQHRHFAKPLPTRTFIPYLSESKFWALFVLIKSEDATSFELEVFAAKGSKDEAYTSTVSYLCKTFGILSPPLVQRCDDDVLGDGVLFWFFYSAFLNQPLENTFEAAKAFLTQAQRLVSTILRDAAAYTEPSINVLFSRSPELSKSFATLSSGPNRRLRKSFSRASHSNIQQQIGRSN